MDNCTSLPCRTTRRGNTIETFCIISTKCETLEGCPPELILCQTGVRWDLSEGSRKMARNECIDNVLSQTICLDAQRVIGWTQQKVNGVQQQWEYNTMLDLAVTLAYYFSGGNYF